MAEKLNVMFSNRKSEIRKLKIPSRGRAHPLSRSFTIHNLDGSPFFGLGGGTRSKNLSNSVSGCLVSWQGKNSRTSKKKKKVVLCRLGGSPRPASKKGYRAKGPGEVDGHRIGKKIESPQKKASATPGGGGGGKKPKGEDTGRSKKKGSGVIS